MFTFFVVVFTIINIKKHLAKRIIFFRGENFPRCHSNWTTSPTHLSANCAMQSALLIANISGVEMTLSLFTLTNRKLSENFHVNIPVNDNYALILSSFFLYVKFFWKLDQIVFNKWIIYIFFSSFNIISKCQIVNFDVTFCQNLICQRHFVWFMIYIFIVIIF